MNILLLGSGGREHALAWKITASPHCSQLWIAPGNPGTAALGTNLPVGVNDFSAIRQECIEKGIDMLVVGPEEPLVNGIYDNQQAKDILLYREVDYLFTSLYRACQRLINCFRHYQFSHHDFLILQDDQA